MKSEELEQIDDNVARTLYVRLPHTIKSSREIEDLFGRNVLVKMPRQSSRHCHVIFSSTEEKMKRLKSIRTMKIDGKKIIACPATTKPTRERKVNQKKIQVPKPKPGTKITKTLHVSNIKPGTKVREIREAFPGCVSVVMVKSRDSGNRVALVKLDGIQLASEYLRKKRERPEVRGNLLVIRTDTRKKKNKPGKKRSTGLKIYDDEPEGKSETESKKGEASSVPETEEGESIQESEDDYEEEEEAESETDPDEATDVEEE